MPEETLQTASASWIGRGLLRAEIDQAEESQGRKLKALDIFLRLGVSSLQLDEWRNMPGTTFHDQVIVRRHVYNYLEKNGMTSLRQVADYVESRTGILPAITTIARLIREYGYELQDDKWVKRDE